MAAAAGLSQSFGRPVRGILNDDLRARSRPFKKAAPLVNGVASPALNDRRPGIAEGGCIRANPALAFLAGPEMAGDRPSQGLCNALFRQAVHPFERYHDIQFLVLNCKLSAPCERSRTG